MVGISGVRVIASSVKSLKPAVKSVENNVKDCAAKISHEISPKKIPIPYANEVERFGYDGAFSESAYDTIRAHMYPCLYDSAYEVGAGVVKGRTNKIFDALKHMNEKYSKPNKEIRLAPLYDNSLRGRNIVTMPNQALEEVKGQGIKRIVDLRSEASVGTRVKIKDGQKYIDDLEYVHIPMNYGSGKEDLETIKRLPEFFDAMNKGNVYIGCNLGSHRTDFAIGLNYALNPAAKEAAPVLYLPVKDVTTGIQRIYNKISKMTPDDHRVLGLSEEFIAGLPKNKQELNEKLLNIAAATKEAK